MVDNLNEKPSFGTRLDQALRVRNKTQTWLAEQLGISDQAISKWKRSGQISRDNAIALCQLLDVNPIWLLEGLGIGPNDLGSNTRDSGAGRVAVVGTAQLGDDGYWAELEYPVGHGDGLIRFHSSDASAYAVRCRGQSMKPRIKDGEFVVLEPAHQISAGDEVLVRDQKGRVMVKEWLYTRDGLVHLLSVNEAHGKITIPLAEVVIMHYVAGIAKATLFEYP